jgi:hypothetical protein
LFPTRRTEDESRQGYKRLPSVSNNGLLFGDFYLPNTPNAYDGEIPSKEPVNPLGPEIFDDGIQSYQSPGSDLKRVNRRWKAIPEMLTIGKSKASSEDIRSAISSSSSAPSLPDPFGLWEFFE